MSNRWEGRLCLVTGGAGFGGAHLCEQLLARGAKVYVLDRWLPRNSYLILSGCRDRVEFIQGDICDAAAVKLLLERCEIDTVFHLAAQPIIPTSNLLPLETLNVNVLGTFAMLEAVRGAPRTQRFVFASSGAYYGTTTTDRAITEEHPPLPAANIYSPSKAAADLAVRSYAQTYGIRAAVCRFMNTYGPGDTNFSRIVPRAIAHLMRDAPYDFGERDDGTTRLDYLHVGDMARAYIAVAEHLDEVSGAAFNFGGGQPIATADLTQLLSRLFDGQRRDPLFHGLPKERPVIKYLDISKAERLLGWRPTIALEAGLGKTIEWYRQCWEKL